jgi:hypothetical protein
VADAMDRLRELMGQAGLPTPERIAAALALAEAVEDLFPSALPLHIKHYVDAYRATAPKPLRTRAEVDAEIGERVRLYVAAYRVQSDECAVTLRKLCQEPTADPKPYGSSSDESPSSPRVDAAAGAAYSTANRITDHDADQREPLEDPEACGCEQSDDLKDRLQECRRLLRFVFDRAKEIRQALETIP